MILLVQSPFDSRIKHLSCTIVYTNSILVSPETTGKTLDKLLSNGICVFIQLNGKTDIFQ